MSGILFFIFASCERLICDTKTKFMQDINIFMNKNNCHDCLLDWNMISNPDKCHILRAKCQSKYNCKNKYDFYSMGRMIILSEYTTYNHDNRKLG